MTNEFDVIGQWMNSRHPKACLCMECEDAHRALATLRAKSAEQGADLQERKYQQHFDASWMRRVDTLENECEIQRTIISECKEMLAARAQKIAELERIIAQVNEVLVVNAVGPRADGDYEQALADLVTQNLAEQRHFDGERVERLDAALRSVEYCVMRGHVTLCPRCGRTAVSGHVPECIVGMALAKEGA